MSVNISIDPPAIIEQLGGYVNELIVDSSSHMSPAGDILKFSLDFQGLINNLVS